MRGRGREQGRTQRGRECVGANALSIACIVECVAACRMLCSSRVSVVLEQLAQSTHARQKGSARSHIRATIELREGRERITTQ
ncbi:hypothetical protein, partial [Bacillus cereus group sp. BC241]|uniref:hypothetical protein n=1 Tax=Bacillus cereus group sp. BC241 TaxID=3445333 RepID=UPI003F69BABA